MDDLERLVGLERYGEMLEALTPKQLAVVALRLEGLNGEEIGELLGVDRQAVHSRLKAARGRLLREFPDLAGEVADRRGDVGVRRRNPVRGRAMEASCG